MIATQRMRENDKDDETHFDDNNPSIINEAESNVSVKTLLL